MKMEKYIEVYYYSDYERALNRLPFLLIYKPIIMVASPI